MKKIVSIVLLLALAVSLSAQPGRCDAMPKRHGAHKMPPSISEVVGDLSQRQKKRIESITEESKKQLRKTDSELCRVRRQIQSLLDKDGDHSKALYPLFEQEGRLMALRSRQMYESRLRVEKVLTPDQCRQFRQSMKRPKPHRPVCPPPPQPAP